MHGSCLCGAVAFEIDRDRVKLYQCHCSLCRKQSGTMSNAAAIVPEGAFRLVRGEGAIRSWVKDTGFRSDFCSRCGSPAPNPLRTLPYYWVPAGLLEGAEDLEVVMHVFTDDRMAWATPALGVPEHPHFPGFDVYLDALR